ncbi:MAG: hypothetical protein H6834_14520 [Planctomycetes bacterium]|nr:hypothetical protein [Planctomycetota bacterium]
MFLDLSFLRMLVLHEGGHVTHLYRDGDGLVKVGIRHVLATPEQAASLLGWSWNMPCDDMPQTEDVQTAWKAVMQAEPGDAASFSQHTNVRLGTSRIDALLRDDLVSVANVLKVQLPRWNSFPIPAQQALIDVAFELGAETWFEMLPALREAAREHDWMKASECCRREHASDKRNRWTKAKFQRAAEHQHLLHGGDSLLASSN